MNIYIVGGANSAGQAALYLASRGSRVTLAVRGPDVRAEMSAYLVDRLYAHPQVTVRTSTEVTRVDGATSLEAVTLTDGEALTVMGNVLAGSNATLALDVTGGDLLIGTSGLAVAADLPRRPRGGVVDATVRDRARAVDARCVVPARVRWPHRLGAQLPR